VLVDDGEEEVIGSQTKRFGGWAVGRLSGSKSLSNRPTA